MQHPPSPAAAIAAALAARAEEVCRRYLPNGRRLGRYWICGDLDGARGRSLFVRLSGSGKPGGWTDAATGQHGDLLDLIRYRINAPTLRAALDEARRFLALPASPATASDAPYDEAKRADLVAVVDTHAVILRSWAAAFLGPAARRPRASAPPLQPGAGERPARSAGARQVPATGERARG